MKKAVLVVDHKDRDLRGIVLIAYWLNRKHNILPFITHTRNEISCLIKYKPELVLAQHIRHRHQREYLMYAKRQKTHIAVCLAEGLPDHQDNTLYYIGDNENMHFVDVFMPWGAYLWQIAKNKKHLEHAAIEPVGSPRFDYHTPRYSNYWMSKSGFCECMGMDPNRATILWMTSFKHCGYGKVEELIQLYQDPNLSDYRRAPTIRELAVSNEFVFNAMSEFFPKVVRDFPQCNFIIKVHPAEKLAVYQEKFGHLKNVLILQSLKSVSLSDVMRHSDIQLTWRCTTSPEAWMMDLEKKVITIEHPGVITDMLKYLTVGNDVVTDYEALKEKINYYLNGGKLDPAVIDRRLNFIRDNLYANDGCSAERCADVLSKYVNSAKPRWSFKNSKIYLRHLRSYRFHQNWLADRRDETHPKYIPPSAVHDEMKRCMQLFGLPVQYRVEM